MFTGSFKVCAASPAAMSIARIVIFTLYPLRCPYTLPHAPGVQKRIQ
jgi:hypothetical protein